MIEIYTTLLGLNVGVFGLAISAILVHLEMVTSQYSFRAPHLLIRRNVWFWAAVVLAAFSGSMAGIGLLRLAFPNTDLLPFVDLFSGHWADTPGFLVATSVLSGLEYMVVFLVVYRYLGYFPVRDVVGSIAKQIKWENFKLFLLQSNGIPEPRSFRYRAFLDNPQVEIELEKLEKIHGQLQKQVYKKENENPFALLIDAMSAAISRHDMEGWQIASSVYKSKHQELFEGYLQDKDNKLLERDMNTYIAKEIIKQLRFLVELAQQEGHPSLALEIIDVAGELGKVAVQPKQLASIGVAIISDFLENEAEQALLPGQEPHVERALAAITEVGLMGIEAPDNYDVSHAAFRSAAKLAEAYIHSGRMIPRSQIATRQLQDEKIPGSLMDAFSRPSLQISTLFPDKVAPDYGVYLSVTARVMEELIQATSEERDYRGLIWSLLNDIQSIAIHAAGCGDIKALKRACWYLGGLYSMSDKYADAAEICDTIADNFADLGLQASIRNITVSPSEVEIMKLPDDNHNLAGIILSHMIKRLSSEHLRRAMRKAADDALPPNGVDQVIDQFIRPAQKLVGDDFGLSFSWGEPE